MILTTLLHQFSHFKTDGVNIILFQDLDLQMIHKFKIQQLKLSKSHLFSKNLTFYSTFKYQPSKPIKYDSKKLLGVLK